MPIIPQITPTLLNTVDKKNVGTINIAFKTQNKIFNGRNILDYTGQDPQYFNRINIADSLIDFFPVSEVLIDDYVEGIIDGIGFVEGDRFDLSITDKATNIDMHNTYCWSEMQMNDSVLGGKIKGINHFILVDNHYFLDRPKTRCFKKMTTSDIVTKIMTEEFKVHAAFITKTTDPHDEYQINETNSEFIRRVSNRAYTSEHPYDPFFTFMNSRNEFYFMCFSDLFNTAENKIEPTIWNTLTGFIPPSPLFPNPKTIGTYTMKFGETMTVDPYQLKSYAIAFGGLPKNKKNYKNTFYTRQPDGAVTKMTETISDHTHLINTGEGLNKALIKKAYYTTGDNSDGVNPFDTIFSLPIEKNPKVQGFHSMGMIDDPLDNFPDGYSNSFFKDSCFSYRWTIQIMFNPLAVAGKLITLDLEGVHSSKKKLTEYSCNWIILSSNLQSDRSGYPIQQLEIARPGLHIDPIHPLKDLF